jgi:membrane protease YdiL (CAAX protease family)
MSALSIFEGLAQSPFIGDVDDRDRDLAHILAAVIGGVGVGLAAGIACWILILVPYTFLAGLGEQGLDGLAKVAAEFMDSGQTGFGVSILRLLESTAVDGVFPLGFVAVAAIMAARPFPRYVTVARAVRWRLLVAGLALSALALTPMILIDRLSAPELRDAPWISISSDWGGRTLYILAALLLIPAAAAEELLFRGWLLRQSAAFTRSPGVLLMFTGALFSAAHLDFTPEAFITRALMGAGFAYMTLRLGGIEFSTGAHAANNLLIVLFVEPLSLKAADVSAGLSVSEILEDLALAAGYIVITEAVARLPTLRRWAGVRPEELSPPGVNAARLL